VADRLERLVNLTATLLDTRRPLTLDELSERVEPRYPEEKTSRRRQFERDKETLRELGVPIRVETVDGFGAEQAYRIHPDDYYLPELSLTEPELAALHVAVTAVRLEGDAGREGLAKLGGLAGEGADTALAELDVSPGLAVLFDAVSRRATVTFSYRGSVRHLDPYGVVLRFGHWYVVGHDRDRDAPRAFRVDRLDAEPELGPDGGFEPPDAVDPAEYVRADPLTYGEDQPVDAHVLVDAPRAGWVVDQLGEEAVVDRRPDGGIVVSLPVVNRAAFRTWVVDLLDHAEVLSPPELRVDMVAWLDTVAGGFATERGPGTPPRRGESEQG
jgi:proteasome accessory factor B